MQVTSALGFASCAIGCAYRCCRTRGKLISLQATILMLEQEQSPDVMVTRPSTCLSLQMLHQQEAICSIAGIVLCCVFEQSHPSFVSICASRRMQVLREQEEASSTASVEGSAAEQAAATGHGSHRVKDFGRRLAHQFPWSPAAFVAVGLALRRRQMTEPGAPSSLAKRRRIAQVGPCHGTSLDAYRLS